MRLLIASAFLLVCNHAFALVDTNADAKTFALYQYLQSSQGNYINIGVQHNNGNNDKYPLTTTKTPMVNEHDINGDGTTYSDTRSLVLSYYNLGATVVSFNWHAHNFSATCSGDCDEYDKTGDVVARILPNGADRATYTAALDRIATYFASLSAQGIPVLFRPFHEADGSWFWWGITGATDAQYIELYRDIVTYFRDVKGLHNIIYVYAPSLVNGYSYDGARYPGDEYVDVFGIDQYSNTDGISSVLTNYRSAYDASVAHGKVFAITEGMRDLVVAPKSNYWTWYFDQILADEKINKASYILFWDAPHWMSTITNTDYVDYLTLQSSSKYSKLKWVNGTSSRIGLRL